MAPSRGSPLSLGVSEGPALSLLWGRAPELSPRGLASRLGFDLPLAPKRYSARLSKNGGTLGLQFSRVGPRRNFCGRRYPGHPAIVKLSFSFSASSDSAPLYFFQLEVRVRGARGGGGSSPGGRSICSSPSPFSNRSQKKVCAQYQNGCRTRKKKNLYWYCSKEARTRFNKQSHTDR